MNREQADELLGAYALDALPEGEAAELRAYLASDPEMAAKAHELRAVASTLALDADPVAPPSGLRAKVVGAVAASEQGTVDREQPSPVSISAQRERREASRGGWRPAAFALGALAAGLAIAVAGLLAWNISLQSDDSSASVTVVRQLMQDTGATAGYIVMFDDGTMAVTGDALPRLDASQTYQLWSLSPQGEASSLGLMQYDDAGVPVATVSFDPAGGAQAVAITIEPAGGSDQPTSEPLYVAEL